MYQSSITRAGQHHSCGMDVLAMKSNIGVPPCTMAQIELVGSKESTLFI